jgi:beta-lactamase class D
MRVSVETDCADNFYEILQTQIGKPYDWRAIVSFVFGDREWQNADSWFCSELQIWAMEQAGFFEKSLMIDANKLSPRDQLLLFSPWLSLVHLNDTVPHNKAIRLSPF